MKTYYVLSMKHSLNGDQYLTWWRPENAGYTYYLEGAGEYTQDQIDETPSYYNDQIDTAIFPVEDIKKIGYFDVSEGAHAVPFTLGCGILGLKPKPKELGLKRCKSTLISK